jgi:hypothetical protein
LQGFFYSSIDICRFDHGQSFAAAGAVDLAIARFKEVAMFDRFRRLLECNLLKAVLLLLFLWLSGSIRPS